MRTRPLVVETDSKMLDCIRLQHNRCRAMAMPLNVFPNAKEEVWTAGRVCSCYCHKID